MPRHHSAAALFAACALAGVALAAGPALAVQDVTLPLRINPNFSRANLSATEQAWYDKSWAHANGGFPTILTRSLYDDTYTYGRSVGDYDAFMLLGLRATGDRAFLDKVRVVTDSMRTKLRDADDACVGGTTDGFLDWRWRAINAGSYDCTNTGGFYGSDHHQLDEAMTHGNIALVAYAFYVNADLDTAYASRAAFWKDYLLNNWEAKWIQRAGGDSTKAWMDNSVGMYKHEAHVVANIMRAAYYLWKITGNPFYKNRADDLAAQSMANTVLNPGIPAAYSWHHQVDNTTTWQAINYAEYTSSVFCDLHLDGYAPYTLVEMKRHMATWRDIVFRTSAPAWTLMDPNVYGGGTQIGISASGAATYARWDSTGTLMSYATAVTGGSPGATSIYTIRACTGGLAAVSTRTAAPNTPPARIANLATSVVNDNNVTLTWTAPADDAGPAARYELRRSSATITDANFANATVVAIGLVPKAGGQSETFVVTGLTPNAVYHFAIRAVDTAGVAGSVSNDVSMTTKATDVVPPQTIQDLDWN